MRSQAEGDSSTEYTEGTEWETKPAGQARRLHSCSLCGRCAPCVNRGVGVTRKFACPALKPLVAWSHGQRA